MKVVLFCHSLISDCNHDNAHFLRGIASELIDRGHRVEIYQPETDENAIEQLHAAFPQLRITNYSLPKLDLDSILNDADLVLVHDWNDADLVKRIGHYRSQSRHLRVFFHDTGHRAPASRDQTSGDELKHYDGILARNEVIREIYLQRGWTLNAWTWHDAADTRIFHPIANQPREGDLVWIGNWEDEETVELREFILDPVRELNLTARAYGAHYSADAIALLGRSGIEYADCLPDFRVPHVFARFGVTVHLPLRPSLPGIPAIRLFEALACGIPLISAPWDDLEGLFTPGRDFLVARDGEEMKRHLWTILADKDLAGDLVDHGLKTIRSRHTCAHRVDELLAIYDQVRPADFRQSALEFGSELRFPRS